MLVFGRINFSGDWRLDVLLFVDQVSETNTDGLFQGLLEGAWQGVLMGQEEVCVF